MRDDRYIHDGWQPHTHGTHTCVTAVCSLATYYLYSSRPVPVPIPVLHRYRYSSQALCATLFFFCNCSSAVAVAVQWQWARSPQCSAQCCVLRAACSACCSTVCRSCSCVAAVLFMLLWWWWCVCMCIHSHSQTQSPARGTAHSIVVYNIYIISMFCLCVPMRDAGCMIRASCIVSIWYILYIEDY